MSDPLDERSAQINPAQQGDDDEQQSFKYYRSMPRHAR